jgi:two-component system, NtrC family, response regulator AtoC
VKIAIIDDQTEISRSLARFLDRLGHETTAFSSGPEFLITLPERRYHLVLSDVTMPEMDGFEVMHRVHTAFPETAVVLITGFGDVPSAVRAMRLGAFDFLLKPIDMTALAVTVERAGEFLRLKEEHRELTYHFDDRVRETTSELHSRYRQLRQAYLDDVLSRIGVFSATLERLFEIAAKFHDDPAIPVLIEGETGSGKEALALFIHHGRDFCPKPFVDLNCASISPGLFESELFGYESGAFTGAKSKGDKGKIELACDGSLFLDEIGELPPDIQAKLLRVLQERKFFRVGGSSRISTRARFICATNADIIERVERGAFREDLFYRLQAGHIVVPPLRERREEIAPLAELFLARLRENRKTMFTGFSPAAFDLLRQQPWKGNIRELKNTVERIATLFDGETVETAQVRSALNFGRRSAPVAEPVAAVDSRTLHEQIADIVRRTLGENNGNKSETARKLGISRDRLYHFLPKG